MANIFLGNLPVFGFFPIRGRSVILAKNFNHWLWGCYHNEVQPSPVYET